MWCRSVKRDLVPYVDGKLPRRRHEAVALHLRRCKRCAAAASGLRELCAMLDRPVEAALPPRMEAAVLRRIRSDDAEPSGARWVARLIPIAAGACTVGLVLYLGRGRPEPEDAARQTGSPQVAPTVVAQQPREAVAPALPGAQSGAVVAGAEEQQGALAGRSDATETTQRMASRGEGISTEEIPPELFRALDLFVDFPVIRHLEEFEHYEAIWAQSEPKAGTDTRGG